MKYKEWNLQCKNSDGGWNKLTHVLNKTIVNNFKKPSISKLNKELLCDLISNHFPNFDWDTKQIFLRTYQRVIPSQLTYRIRIRDLNITGSDFIHVDNVLPLLNNNLISLNMTNCPDIDHCAIFTQLNRGTYPKLKELQLGPFSDEMTAQLESDLDNSPFDSEFGLGSGIKILHIKYFHDFELIRSTESFLNNIVRPLCLEELYLIDCCVPSISNILNNERIRNSLTKLSLFRSPNIMRERDFISIGFLKNLTHLNIGSGVKRCNLDMFVQNTYRDNITYHKNPKVIFNVLAKNLLMLRYLDISGTNLTEITTTIIGTAEDSNLTTRNCADDIVPFRKLEHLVMLNTPRNTKLSRLLKDWGTIELSTHSSDNFANCLNMIEIDIDMLQYFCELLNMNAMNLDLISATFNAALALERNNVNKTSTKLCNWWYNCQWCVIKKLINCLFIFDDLDQILNKITMETRVSIVNIIINSLFDNKKCNIAKHTSAYHMSCAKVLSCVTVPDDILEIIYSYLCKLSNVSLKFLEFNHYSYIIEDEDFLGFFINFMRTNIKILVQSKSFITDLIGQITGYSRYYDEYRSEIQTMLELLLDALKRCPCTVGIESFQEEIFMLNKRYRSETRITKLFMTIIHFMELYIMLFKSEESDTITNLLNLMSFYLQTDSYKTIIFQTKNLVEKFRLILHSLSMSCQPIHDNQIAILLKDILTNS